MRPNPSIERTFQRPLRAFGPPLISNVSGLQIGIMNGTRWVLVVITGTFVLICSYMHPSRGGGEIL